MYRFQAAVSEARERRNALLAGQAVDPGVVDLVPDEGDDSFAAPREDPIFESTAVDHVPQKVWDSVVDYDPDETHLANQRIVTCENGAKSAPFDVLRTRVLQQMMSQKWKRLAITSPGPTCGKSTVTMNLAFSLARQPDVRTLVIDLDLRRPMLAKMLGLTGGDQISAAIRGRSRAADQMVRVRDNLAFATTANAVHDSAELLQGQRMETFLAGLETDFEPTLILVDLPPMLVSDDAIAFLPHVDCALMIAAAEQSTLRQVDHCEKELAGQTNMLGVVLNKCGYPGESYGYGYGYGYEEAS